MNQVCALTQLLIFFLPGIGTQIQFTRIISQKIFCIATFNGEVYFFHSLFFRNEKRKSKQEYISFNLKMKWKNNHIEFHSIEYMNFELILHLRFLFTLTH